MGRLVVISALVIGTAFGCWRWAPATFTVKNESGQPIRSMTVEVAGKTYSFENVPPGGEVSGWFYVDDEESLNVRGQLADGTNFADECGYVVWEQFAPQITAVVRPGGEVETR